MICTKCSRELPEGSVFCCFCGRKLVRDPRRAPRRGNNTGSVFYDKKRKTWTAQVTVGSKPGKEGAQRQSIRRTKTGFKTRSEAQDYIPTLRASGGTKTALAPRLEHYWETYQSNDMKALGGSKKTAYRIAWKKLSRLHNARVDSISVNDLREVVSSTCTTHYTARDCKSLLSALFKMAAADGYANKDLPSFIILPKLNETEQTPFSETEQAALWKLYEAGDIRAAIPLLMIYTGMMPGEAMKLKVDQIDMAGRRITGAGMKTAVRKKTPIVLAETILPLVQDLIDHAQPSGYVWKQNEPDWYADYYAALEAAGCRRLPPYSCRHTTATALAISEGIAPQTIKKVMRWSTVKMLDRYAHPQVEDQLNAVDKIRRVANTVANT